MARKSIFLIGMMGSGKSTIGRALARELDMTFIDCDRELEVRSGVTITTMFEVEGEAAFREREAALIEELTQRDRIVLATGGGAILQESSRIALRSRGLVIYLRATVDELARRTARDRGRPLLQTDDRRARLAQLLQQREPLYGETAHAVFHSSSGNPNRLVRQIIEEPVVRSALGTS
jgi:shikimate kinase